MAKANQVLSLAQIAQIEIERRRRRRLKIAHDAVPDEPAVLWKPFPGKPQELAYLHPADELFYGGKAGGGKSDLLLGVAGTKQQNSLILRREFPRARALIERSRQIFARKEGNHSKDSYNESLHIWRLKDERTVEFGACQYEDDKGKYQGRPHDLKGFDEITEFTESQFRFINIWNRPLDDQADPDLRCRVIATGNPPTSADGEWVMDYWGPFIDPDHPKPAEHGSMVWYVRQETEEGDHDVEVGRTSLEEVWAYINHGHPIKRPVVQINGKDVEARSRSFIPGSVEDNPIMMARGYDRQLDALPKDLREKFRHGLFVRITESVEGQIIPTAWVNEAQERWLEFMGVSMADGRAMKTKDAIAMYRRKMAGAVQSAIGADPARGGDDECVISARYDNWFAPPLIVPGSQVPNGRDVAIHIASLKEGKTPVFVDVIGIGSSPYDACIDAGWETIALNGGEGAVTMQGKKVTDRSGLLTFANKRAQWIWQFMEMLDPQYDSQIMLPPDPRIKSDLCSMRRASVDGGVITVEGKDKIKKRLGRSPDRGEGIIYASIDRKWFYDAINRLTALS